MNRHTRSHLRDALRMDALRAKADADQPSITCPRCQATSYNPHDISAGYCGRCHWWTSDADLGRPEVIAQAEAGGAIEPLP